jgi:hypothetical protein
MRPHPVVVTPPLVDQHLRRTQFVEPLPDGVPRSISWPAESNKMIATFAWLRAASERMVGGAHDVAQPR